MTKFDHAIIIGQGQPRVIIYINSEGLNPIMLHTKFQGNRSSGLGEDFFKVFNLYGHEAHLGHVTRTKYINFLFPFAYRTNSPGTTYQVSRQSAQ